MYIFPRQEIDNILSQESSSVYRVLNIYARKIFFVPALGGNFCSTYFILEPNTTGCSFNLHENGVYIFRLVRIKIHIVLWLK